MSAEINKVFLHKLHFKCIKMSNIAIININDNNNFAPSIFRSLCEFVSDCFGPLYCSSGATLPQKETSVQNNHLRFHTITSKKMVRSYYCLNNNTKAHFLFTQLALLCGELCKTVCPMSQSSQRLSPVNNSGLISTMFLQDHWPLEASRIFQVALFVLKAHQV